MNRIGLLSWRSIVISVACLLLVWQLSSALVFYVKHNGTAIRFEYPVDYGEGPLLDQAVRLARCENIYHNDLSRPPYTISNYPPLFVLVQVPFVWSFGPAFWYGRLISTLSMIAAAIFIGLTLYTITRDRLAACFGGATLLAFPYVLFWSALNRIDSMALGLSWAGLYLIARSPGCRKEIIWAAILLSLAVYTRQSYALAAPLTAFVWLLRGQSRRLAFEFGALVAGICLGLFLLLNVTTQGGFFLNIVTANVNPFSWGGVKQYAGVVGQYLWPLLVVAGVLLALGQGIRSRILWLVIPYLIGAGLSGLTIGKEGSNVNYLLELTAAFSLLGGSLIAWTQTKPVWRAIILLVLALQVYIIGQWSKSDSLHRLYGRTLQAGELSRLKTCIDKAKRPVLIDEYIGMVPLAGKNLVYQPFEFKMLSDARVWDQQNFVVSILNKEYALIMLYDPGSWNSRGTRWTREQLWAIQFSYRYTGRLANTLILIPK